jgi:hypothetical protein
MALVHTRMSAPTDDFKLVPGLSPEEAAGLIAHAIVDRPPSIAPWWASTAALIGTIARGPSEAIVRRYARMHGDPAPRAASAGNGAATPGQDPRAPRVAASPREQRPGAPQVTASPREQGPGAAKRRGA